MKNGGYGVILTILVIVVLLAVGGCESRKDNTLPNVVVIPTNPYTITGAEADWLIVLNRVRSEVKLSGKSQELFNVRAKYLKNPAAVFSQDDTALLLINDQPLALEYASYLPDNFKFEGSFDGETGTSYDIGFKFNGKLLMKNTLRLPDMASVTYPATYLPSQTALIQWSLPASSQFQFASLTSFQPGLSDDDVLDMFRAKLDPLDRTYFFPVAYLAQSSSELAQTGYRLALTQISCKIVNKIAIQAQTCISNEYYYINDAAVPYDVEQITGDYCDAVVFFDLADSKADSLPTNIIVKFVYPAALPAPGDSISMVLPGGILPLQPIPGSGYYYATTDLPAGDSLAFTLRLNAYPLLNSHIRTTYPASLDFPPVYNPQSSYELNWTLPASNGYQFFQAKSFRDDGSLYGQHSTYFQRLAKDVRNHYLPAQAVQNFGAGTEYTLSLLQLNYGVQGRYVLMSMSELNANYYTKHGKKHTIQASLNRLESVLSSGPK